MSIPSYNADVLVVGAGPAGVAAAVMATSLNMRTVVIEADSVASKLHTIGALNNVPGSWSSGPQLAEALASDLLRLQQSEQCSVVQARAVSAKGYEDRAELILEDGRVLTAQAIVVATGVAALTPSDADWVEVPAQFSAPPLWRTAPAGLGERTCVLGGDRPLGTWLRAHPKVEAQLHVLYPPADDYKIAEVAGDDRVRLMPISHVAVTAPACGEGWTIEVKDRNEQRQTYPVTAVLSNIGSKPSAIQGLALDGDGYCPLERQHPRIRIAGDLRSGRYQRIATAQGSGAEAVLACYYAKALENN